MNIEEAIEMLKRIYVTEFNTSSIYDNVPNVNLAIETLLTAYEKEKEEHKKECHNCDEYTAKLGELETENKMLKAEIEKQKEKKAYINGTNIADKLCNKKWIEKIKVKVIEIKDRPVKDEFITASQGKLNTIIELESLLNKEEKNNE